MISSQNPMIASLTKDTRKSLRNTLNQTLPTYPTGWNNLRSPGIPADEITIVKASTFDHLIRPFSIFVLNLLIFLEMNFLKDILTIMLVD